MKICLLSRLVLLFSLDSNIQELRRVQFQGCCLEKSWLRKPKVTLIAQNHLFLRLGQNQSLLVSCVIDYFVTKILHDLKSR